ncbi:MAG: hypothetical protein V1857_04000 [archaeon]
MSRNHLMVPLFIGALLLKAYDPIVSPVIGALDPWGWVVQTRRLLATGQLDTWFTQTGYPPTFLYMIASISSLGIDAYDVIRYIPILASLCVIPIYLLILETSGSRQVAAATALLTVTARWHFMRTSIGIPEGLSHTLLVFTLYYVLRSLRTEKRMDRACAAILMAVTVLFYHFTLPIFAAFLALLPFFVRFRSRGSDFRTLVTVVVPALILGGVAWFFWVTGSIISTYFTATFPGYQAPSAAISVWSSLYLLAYSIGKLGAITLSTVGYVMTILALLGLAGLIAFGRNRKTMRMETRFLLSYLIALALLAFVLETTYNFTGIAGTGISRLYIFSYLTMPAAALASHAIASGVETLRKFMRQIPAAMRDRRISKAIPVAIMILVCVANLTSINYYKAWSGKGLGFLESHYYVKFLTDEEYYALAYLRDNTPRDSIILTVGVDEGILTHHATVSRRTMISINDLVDEGKFVIANITTVSPELVSERHQSMMSFDGKDGHIYFLSGIRKVSSETAARDEPPPPKKIMMEQFLTARITDSKGYERVYRNNQVTVLKLSSTNIEQILA